VLILFIYGFAVACSIILATAFFLELFNASNSAPFVRWVSRATARIMQPFRGIFPAVESEGGSVFDPALLFAMFMYWLLAVGMHALVGWLDRKIAAARASEMWGGPQTQRPAEAPVRIPAAEPAPATVPPAPPGGPTPPPG
jgi:hypothetical protein